jgi:hypothetical protein
VLAGGVLVAERAAGGGAFPLHMSRYSCQVEPVFFHRTIALPSGPLAGRVLELPAAHLEREVAQRMDLRVLR